MAGDFELFHFDGHSIERCARPPWYQRVHEQDGDWEENLRSIGMTKHEEFGKSGDKVVIYTGSEGFLVEYHDVHEPVAAFLISDAGRYLQFRAQYVQPWVWLIERTDQASAG